MKTSLSTSRRRLAARRVVPVVVSALVFFLNTASGAWAEPWTFKADFENGLAPPWGTGQRLVKGTAPWWNHGGCASTAEADFRVRLNGKYSLKISNPTPQKWDVYGSTQQPVEFKTGHKYRIEVWALAKDLASTGGVCLVVDQDWDMRPIRLAKGTYDWTKFVDYFTWPGGTGQCRILSQDRGEVWLDDLLIVDLGPDKNFNNPTAND